MKIHKRRRRRAQSVTEYVLGVAVIAIAMGVGFLVFEEATEEIFDNARKTVQVPYP